MPIKNKISDKFRVTAICILCVFVLTALVYSSKGSENEISRDIKFEVIKDGFISGFTEEKMMVIDNNEDYQKMMAVVYANLDQMPIIPEVDFDKYTVIAVAMGTKTTGGYTINVDRVTKTKSSVTVNLTETSSGPGCVVTDMVTSPFQVIKVKKIKKEIKFNISKKIQDCR